MSETGLKQKLSGDLKQAMRDGDKVKRDTIRMLTSAINNAEIARRGPLSESDVLGIIAKEVRLRKESIDAFKQGERSDLADREEAEMAVLQTYLPQQMSREEIAEAVREIIAEVDAQGPADKGKVMPAAIARLKGRADGREINQVVTELLAA